MKIVRIFPKYGIRNLLPSDTLWGNIIFAIKRLYGNKYFSDILENFLKGNPLFKISSCFPFEKNVDQEFVYYFPIPISPFLSDLTKNVQDENNLINSMEEMVLFKEFKRIKFIEKKYFEEFLNAEINEFELFRLFSEASKKSGNNNNYPFKFISTPKKTFTLHNTIDRWNIKTTETKEGGALYWDEEYVFDGEKNGLFFLVEGDIDLIIPALRLLSDIGIAGNNSIGKGKFYFDVEDFFIRTPNNPNSQVTLSLIYPNDEDLNIISNLNNNLWYELKLRKGYTGIDFEVEPVEKNAFYVFGEGSVFMTTNFLNGKLLKTAHLNNGYEVYNYYYGYSISSFFKV